MQAIMQCMITCPPVIKKSGSFHPLPTPRNKLENYHGYWITCIFSKVSINFNNFCGSLPVIMMIWPRPPWVSIFMHPFPWFINTPFTWVKKDVLPSFIECFGLAKMKLKLTLTLPFLYIAHVGPVVSHWFLCYTNPSLHLMPSQQKHIHLVTLLTFNSPACKCLCILLIVAYRVVWKSWNLCLFLVP